MTNNKLEKEKQLVITLFKEELEKYGFKKNNLNWSKDIGELIQVISLQKSLWGYSFYINIGIQIKSMGSVPNNITAEECSVEIRYDELEIDNVPLNILNLEDESMSISSRLVAIKKILTEGIIPFFEKINNSNDIRLLFSENKKVFLMASGPGRQFLGIKYP